MKPPLVIDSSASSPAELPDTANDEISEHGMFSFLPKWLFVFVCFTFQHLSLFVLIPRRRMDALFYSS